MPEAGRAVSPFGAIALHFTSAGFAPSASVRSSFSDADLPGAIASEPEGSVIAAVVAGGKLTLSSAKDGGASSGAVPHRISAFDASAKSSRSVPCSGTATHVRCVARPSTRNPRTYGRETAASGA